MYQNQDYDRFLPDDGFAGTLIGRVWKPQDMTGTAAGPSPVLITQDGVYDLSHIAPTCAELINQGFQRDSLALSPSQRIGSYAEIMANTFTAVRQDDIPFFLSPIDLQAIKACGVTFAVSMLERVIEERAGGNAAQAEAVRQKINAQINADLSKVKPGSAVAEELKAVLQKEGWWSQYLEVGLGPYAEVFTKAQPLSSVGTGADVGILPISSWNNPEPEIVLVVNAQAEVIGATLGNDVNLRDIEGRSALLLGKAKDNNASCAIGPFLRLFDDTFTLNDVRQAEVSLTIAGDDDFLLSEVSQMSQISRDVLELVAQTINEHHQYPDGLVLFTGTLFAPTQDRAGQGQGFTHHLGDVVTIRSEKLGSLQNRVNYSHQIAPWKFGLTALMRNLSQRGLL